MLEGQFEEKKTNRWPRNNDVADLLLILEELKKEESTTR